MFNALFTKTEEYTKLAQALGSPGACALFGVPGAGRALIYAALAQALGRPLCIVTPGEAEATRFAGDLNALGIAAAVFPARDYVLRPIEGTGREYEYRRLAVLGDLVGGRLQAVCVPDEGLTQYTTPRAEFCANTRTLHPSDTLPRAELTALLYGAGWAAKAIGISQLATTCAVFLALVGCASVVVALITAILRFYKGVFGAEGYLIQTLPVGKGSIILSKAITAYVLLLLAILGTMQLMGAQEFFKGLNEQLGGSLVTMGVYVGVSMLIGLALTIGELYFAITLANTKTFSSNSVLFSVLFYFCTTMVAGLLEVVAMLIVPLGLRIGADGASFVFENMWGTLIESLRISGGALLYDWTWGVYAPSSMAHHMASYNC